MSRTIHATRCLAAAIAWSAGTALMPAVAAPAHVAQAPHHCANCGVVESVQQVHRQGQAKGIGGTQVTPGMAIGGVVGGVLGNQFGHGSGRAATTVLGAAGGAYAGHTIEKNRAPTYTGYLMRVRMDDGSYRTIEQRDPVARGKRVVIEGKTARLIAAHPVHG